MKKLLIFILLFGGRASAQTNVYTCAMNPTVSQGDIDNNDNFGASCILFEQAQTYTFGQSDTKTVTAATHIAVEPNFSAENFTPGGFMHLKICDDLRDVVCFSHSDLGNVEALKKFEFGIQLPQAIEDRIQYYIATGDSSDPVNGGINPYLEWQLNAKARFVQRGSGTSKTIYGFYYQEYKRDKDDPVKNNWHWDAVPTTHHLRFRYAPPTTGVYDIYVDVTLGDGTVLTYCPFSIGVTPNTDDDGYVEVAPNKRVLQRQNELFFPVGQNAPFPRESGPDIGGWVGAYGVAPVNPSPFYEFDTLIDGLSQAGLNYYRLLLNPNCLDIEFEEVGNYTDRLNYGWEIDKILERSDSLDMYIHFNMMVHNAFESPSSAAYLNWDWSDRDITYGFPQCEGQFAYKTKFNLPEEYPETFLSDPGCRKFYKQKIRYLISRYGYSTHVALFELMSEMSNVGKHYEIVNVNDTVFQLNKTREAYVDDAQHRLWVGWWHDEMAKYIKNDLGHTEHLVSVSYGVLPIAPDYSYGIPEVDVITYNRYSDILGGKYRRYVFEADSLFQAHQKPYMHSETGPTEEDKCDDGTTYLKEAWMAAFTGVAGFNIWNGFDKPELWPRLGEIRRFIHDNPQVRDLFMGIWEPNCTNDNTYPGIPNEATPHALLKEAVFINGVALDQYGELESLKVGVVSNLTDNYYTHTDPLDTTWCTDNQPQVPQRTPTDLTYQNAAIYFHETDYIDYAFQWFDNSGTYQSSTTLPFAYPAIVQHPLSCATASCTQNTSEIPFIATWVPSQFGKTESGNRSNSAVSLPEKSTHSFSIYPNPANSELTIFCDMPQVEYYEIRDALGRLVMKAEHKEPHQSLTISHLSPGIFVILGIGTDAQIKTKERWVKN